MAIDLQPMAPIEGVIQVQGDITNARTAEVVRIFLPQILNFAYSNLFYVEEWGSLLPQYKCLFSS